MNIMSLSKVRNSSFMERIGERPNVENTHIFREETLKVGHMLDWISPDSRIIMETRML
jgi:hypothetical protein